MTAEQDDLTNRYALLITGPAWRIFGRSLMVGNGCQVALRSGCCGQNADLPSADSTWHGQRPGADHGSTFRLRVF
jgi:hypothetical protein